MRTRWLVLVGAAVGLQLWGASGCRTPPKALDPEGQAKVSPLLAAYANLAELSGLVGSLPASCIQDTPATQVCQWQGSDGLRGGQPLATALGTRDRINLICALALDAAPRGPGSCTAHPRRSNRTAWMTGARRSGRRTPTPSEQAELTEKTRRVADRWIAEADTLLKMSRLMGAIPNGCVPRSPTEQTCTWRASNQTLGHGLLAAWIGAPMSKKILLRCAFPTDGGPRAAATCTAEIGA